jgi:glyoxylase-like metal-dependent hydrolase (beta-lactamase superfamily II)
MAAMDSAGSARFEQVAPGIRRLLAPNPSHFTFTGTQTYVVGERDVAVIDPGPDDPAHVAALVDALGKERVTAILVTHTHRDHSPASRPLADATGAPIIGCAPLAIPTTVPAPTPASTSIMPRTRSWLTAGASSATTGRSRRSRRPATPRTISASR